MCSGLLQPSESSSHGPAMTIRPGLHHMNGTSGAVQAPPPDHFCQGHDTPQFGAQISHTAGPNVEQSKMDSQRIVDAMLVQERQAYAQEGEGAAACSTDQFARADFRGASARGEGNGNSAGGADAAGNKRGGDVAETEARQQMVGLVEELKRMDDLACFIEPVDDSFAPGYSKIILRPMSFSVMLKKAKNGEYSLIKDLLEDFELICFNAMKYNAKRSKIYNAANTLLRKGKKHIRAFTVVHRPAELERKSDKRAVDTQPASKVKTRRELAKSAEEQVERPRSKQGEIDVVGEAGGAEFRQEDRYEGSTDCSSSYAETASDSEEEWGYDPEVSSRLRADDRDAEGREKRSLHPEWKKQRRGIEWRARWLEMRMVDIQEKADRYSHLARQLKSRQHTHALHPAGQKQLPPPSSQQPSLPTTSPAAFPSPQVPSPQLLEAPPALPQAVDHAAMPPGHAAPTASAPRPAEPSQMQTAQESQTAGATPEVPGVAAPSQQVAPVAQTLGQGAAKALAPSSLTVAHVQAPGGASPSDVQAPAGETGRQLAPASAPAVSIPVRKGTSTAARVDLEAVQLPKDDEGAPSALPGETLVGRVKQSLRHHRKRKKVEDEPLTEQFMAQHPLLSRYDKASRKRPRMPGDDTVSMADVDLRSMSPGIEAPPERAPRPYLPPLPTVLEDEPMDCLLEKIEALQQRLHVLRSQLHYSAANRAAPPRRPPAQTPRPLGQNPAVVPPRQFVSPRPSPTPSPRNAPSPSPGARSMMSPSPSGSPKAEALERTRSLMNVSGGVGAIQRSGSGAALVPGRRRTADYDISNVVSSVSVGRKTVEQLQHTKIETPRWRLVQQTFDELVGGDSSEEDTDDDSYARRHAPLEAQEKLRYMAPPSKHQGLGKPTGKIKEKPRGKPQQDGHTELISPRPPAYKRRKAQGGKNENGVAKAKTKGGGLPPAGAKGKAPPGKVAETASADGSDGAAKDGGEGSVSQEDILKRRASPGLTIQIPEIH